MMGMGYPIAIFDQMVKMPEARRDGMTQAVATVALVKDGFVVMPYTNDDVVTAKRLRDAGAACVMPLAAPIGSGLGVQNLTTLRILREEIRDVPVIVEDGKVTIGYGGS